VATRASSRRRSATWHAPATLQRSPGWLVARNDLPGVFGGRQPDVFHHDSRDEVAWVPAFRQADRNSPLIGRGPSSRLAVFPIAISGPLLTACSPNPVVPKRRQSWASPPEALPTLRSRPPLPAIMRPKSLASARRLCQGRAANPARRRGLVVASLHRLPERVRWRFAEATRDLPAVGRRFARSIRPARLA
jgi:hypothetical protein